MEWGKDRISSGKRAGPKPAGLKQIGESILGRGHSSSEKWRREVAWHVQKNPFL